MFRDKYKADNEKINPDEATMKYLSVRLNDMEKEPEQIKELPFYKKNWFRPAVAIAACAAISLCAGGLYLSKKTPKTELPTVASTDSGDVSENTTVSTNTSAATSTSKTGTTTAAKKIIQKVKVLKTDVTYAELYALIKSMESKNNTGTNRTYSQSKGSLEAAPAAAGQQNTAAEDTASGDYSKTNTQVDGVDEADIVKTDGKYIYTLTTNGRINIVAVQGSKMNKTASIDCTSIEGTSTKSSPSEMYVNGDRLIVIKNMYDKGNVYPAGTAEAKGSYAVCDMMWYGGGSTSAAIYDITDRSHPKLMVDSGQSGNYLSSRIVGQVLYLITNDTVYNTAVKDKPETYVPQLFKNGKGTVMAAKDISIDIKPKDRQYLVVSAINVTDPGNCLSSKAVFGCGSTIYASTENLLIASYMQNKTTTTVNTSAAASSAVTKPQATAASGAVEPQAPDKQVAGNAAVAGNSAGAGISVSGVTAAGGKATSTTYTSATNLIRFSLNKGQIELAATGSIPGTLLNQFSMDEYKETFRFVTTANNYTETYYGDGNSGVVSYSQGDNSNALYTLNESLQVIGKIENVAKGERVYSVRFSGDIGYFVTFRQVDPLFAVDLTNPSKPKILSALKIPGLSDYLHPYSSGLLFGLGREATDEGRVTGLKLSMFDVSNPASISEKHKLVLSEYYSEASYNHKAIVVSPTRGLIAFPADGKYLIFTYSAKDGFKKVGECRDVNGVNYYNLRGLYIGNVFYVCSDSNVTAYSMSGYVKLAELAY